MRFSFECGEVAIHDIKSLTDQQLDMRTGDSAYDWSKGKLYKYNIKGFPRYAANTLFLLNDQISFIASNKYRYVVPVSPFNPFGLVHPDVYLLDSLLDNVSTRQVTAKKITILVDSAQIGSEKDTVGTYCIDYWHNMNANANVFFLDSKFGTLEINNSFLICKFQSVIIDSLIFSNVEFKESTIIDVFPLPKYIRLNEIVCKNEKDLCDFTQFLITDSAQLCNLNLGRGVASQIKANYKYFNLVFDSATSVYDRERIYTELLSMQQANFFLDGYEKLDKEYKAFKCLIRNSFVAKIQNWIDKHWWDYGYDKFMVIKNSVKLFLLFFVINLLAYKELAKVYHPEKFKKFDERLDSNNTEDEFSIATRVRNYIIRIPAIFLYTAFVFWGFKLDLKELEIKKPLFMAILIGQYIIGLVCLAYIANYIISK